MLYSYYPGTLGCALEPLSQESIPSVGPEGSSRDGAQFFPGWVSLEGRELLSVSCVCGEVGTFPQLGSGLVGRQI